MSTIHAKESPCRAGRNPAELQGPAAAPRVGRAHRSEAPSRGALLAHSGADLKNEAISGTSIAGTREWRCRIGRHSRRCAALLLLALGLGCAGSWLPAWLRTGLHVVTAPAPSASERYCAWYGDSDGETLYVGLAPFWSAMRAADGDPRADLHLPGPQAVGRFDLRRERWLPPLEVGLPESRSGVWDVHVQQRQLYYTTFYESAGRIDLDSGATTRFDAIGAGLNEWAPGPDGRALVSRYGSGLERKGNGELLSLDPAGNAAQRWPMGAPPGFFVAPKTPAWNPVQQRLLATTDLLAEFDGETRHDGYLLELRDEARGWQIQPEPELQFVAALADGTEYRVEAHPDGRLWLRRLGKPGARLEDAWVLLDPEFAADVDFVQDLKLSADGRVVLTRWSGAVHVVAPGGSVAGVQLPRLDPDGLYYTAVIRGDRLCASYCADVTVVCTDAP